MDDTFVIGCMTDLINAFQSLNWTTVEIKELKRAIRDYENVLELER